MSQQAPPDRLEQHLLEAWDRLQFDLEVREGFWFSLAVADTVTFLERLFWQAQNWCDDHGRQCLLYRPYPAVARDVVFEILENAVRKGERDAPALYWVALHDAGNLEGRKDEWDQGARALLGALNERRDLLRTHLRAGLVLAGSLNLKFLLRVHAPDLFSIRSVILESSVAESTQSAVAWQDLDLAERNRPTFKRRSEAHARPPSIPPETGPLEPSGSAARWKHVLLPRGPARNEPRPEVLEAGSRMRAGEEGAKEGAAPSVGRGSHPSFESAAPTALREGRAIRDAAPGSGVGNALRVHEPVFDPALVVRDEEALFGRRTEQAMVLDRLEAADCGGVLIHGIAGIGKSTFAVQMVRAFARHPGTLLASCTARDGPGAAVAAVGRTLLNAAYRERLEEDDPVHQLGRLLGAGDLSWKERLAFLGRNLPESVRLVLLLDGLEREQSNGEDRDDPRLDLVRVWLDLAAQARAQIKIVVTRRSSGGLPAEIARRLQGYHLGPLDEPDAWAMTRSLDGLRTLDFPARHKALQTLGGHPLGLEFLDALVAGTPRFPDLAYRMNRLHSRQDEPRAPRTFQQALEATVSLLAEYADLETSLSRVARVAAAGELLKAVSVFRRPVPEAALPALAEKEAGTPGSRTWRLSLSRMLGHRAWRKGIDVLREEGVFAPVHGGAPGPVEYLVHRWVAQVVQERVSAEQRTQAHRAAARWWLHRAERVGALPDQVWCLVEALHHLGEAGENRDHVLERLVAMWRSEPSLGPTLAIHRPVLEAELGQDFVARLYPESSVH